MLSIPDGIRDATLWRQNFVHLVSKDGSPTKYVDTPARKKVRRYLRTPGHYFVLKARQMGVSTEILLGALHRAMYRHGSKIAIVAHTDEAAKSLLRLFKSIYDKLTFWVRDDEPIISCSAHEIRFQNGSYIRAGTAYSESWRSQTYDYLHLSEVAHWTDYLSTVRALLQTASPKAIVIYETTPNGPNEFHQAWMSEDDHIQRIFLPWTDNPEYESDAPLSRPLLLHEQEYVDDNQLSEKQTSWFFQTLVTKCQLNLDSFKQEYPIDADSCFLLSGRRFFPFIYQVDEVTPEGEEYTLYYPPHPDGIYGIGIDGASGSPTGDRSACVILDYSFQPARIAARLSVRKAPNAFAKMCVAICKNYRPRAIVVESNHVGVAIAETMDKEGCKVLKVDGKLFWTTTTQSRPKLLSRLHQALTESKIDVNDPVISRELNSFCYNKKGKPEAETGCHDDTVFALALALVAARHVPKLNVSEKETTKQFLQLSPDEQVQKEIRHFQRTGKAFQVTQPKKQWWS